MGSWSSASRDQNHAVAELEKVFLSESPPSEWEVKVYSQVGGTCPSTLPSSERPPDYGLVDNKPASSSSSSSRNYTRSDDRSKRRRLRDSWNVTGERQTVAEVSKEEMREVEKCVEVCLRDHAAHDLSARDTCPPSDGCDASDGDDDDDDDDDDDVLPSSCVMPRTVMKRSRDDADVY
ncbi:hypothetical protein FOZ61_001276 [Perkinsus olseni]|uniref:Uncharacterized protein n=1 Tax=Perkinsus olseni TaxID=32597 RepID=A0A7J6LXF2_PEROL|nr:hypothetical protein FOZ61_001276 [Perkinsus olseni]